MVPWPITFADSTSILQDCMSGRQGERNMVKDVRRFAEGDLGLGRSQQFSQFYWFADKPTG